MQTQFVMKLIDKLKPKYLLITSIFWLFANKFITLIIVVIRLVSISGYGTFSKDKKYNSNILMLGSKYSKEDNIQKLKARFLLKQILLNNNTTFIEPSPKPCK